MGVPKFFRYISERYPCLSELAREQHIPCFDNMYLDMNGIIHNCTHPDDSNIHFKLTEEDMFTDILNYIDKLFFLIKPQKLFFMAIDGVAPRAKMNQQRSRRFRSAKESEMLASQATSRGEILPEDRFDSNCITPGTEFMERLHAALRHFIKYKISCDPFWQKCRVILSGHDCPGEGEHKIMDYIRYLKSQPNYNAYTRHCLYGLDADLMILGLCTHELHFAVLREEVQFGKKNKKQSVENTRFFLLHLGLMREYLELEFDELRKKDVNFDIAKLIDDWVLMGFLVGNDFVPHLPCMHISTNALPLLYKTYIKVYPELGGNINENGKLNLERLGKYFEALSEVEFEIFQENWVDLKYFEAKKSVNGIDEAFDVDIEDIKNGNQDEELQALIDSTEQFFSDDCESMTESQHIAEEFEKYKHNYYMNKLEPDEANSETKREQALAYITALQWILDYYYLGVQSWDWYYPYHYAPFISDLVNINDHKIEYSMGKPFLPFAQLLAVLPAASKKLLPVAYHNLMTNPTSNLLPFYPTDFKTDLNGKQHEWEAVVLIPFIDEKILLDEMMACESELMPHERKRNSHGPMYQYDFSKESQGHLEKNYSLNTLSHVYCKEKAVESKEIAVVGNSTACVELPNLMRHVFFPGFPTFKHLEFDFELKNARVRVFDFAGRNENVILLPKAREKHNDVDSMVVKYLDKVVYIGWPHLIKAKVVKVSSSTTTISNNGEIVETDARAFQHHTKAAEEHLKTRMGIEVADYDVMLHVQIYEGTNNIICNNTGKIIQEDVWRKHETLYPAQAIVSDITVHSSSSPVTYNKVEDFYAVDSKVFFIGSPYYGSQGVVIDPMLIYECGRLKVNITVPNEPNFEQARIIQTTIEQDYLNSYEAAGIIGISAKCLARLTNPFLVMPGKKRELGMSEHVSKTNIAVELRFGRKREERAGYSRHINNQWFYTSRAIELLQEYSNCFPRVIDYLSTGNEYSNLCFEEEIFSENAASKIKEIEAWLKEQPHNLAERIPSGGQLLAKETIVEVIEAIDQLKTLPVKTVKLQVKPHLLLKPDMALPSTYRAKCAIRLFDRVVIVKTTYMVPIGSKGTVIGIYPTRDPNPVRLECVGSVENFYDILFDKKLPSGNDVYGLADSQVYRVPESSLLLIYLQDNGPQGRDKNAPIGEQQNTKMPLATQRRPNNNFSNNTNNIRSSNWKNQNLKNASEDIASKNISWRSNNLEDRQKNKTSSKWGFNRKNSNANDSTDKSTTGTTETLQNIPGTSQDDANHQAASIDFWIPNAFARNMNNNTNNNNNKQSPQQEKTVELPSSMISIMPNFAQRNVQTTATISYGDMSVRREFDEKTETLRNMLGIKPTTFPAESPQNPMPPNLPQPPQSWRNEARQHINQKKNRSGGQPRNREQVQNNSNPHKFGSHKPNEMRHVQKNPTDFIPTMQKTSHGRMQVVGTGWEGAPGVPFNTFGMKVIPNATTASTAPAASVSYFDAPARKIGELSHKMEQVSVMGASPSTMNRKNEVKKSPKTPKIAAKFDMA